MLAGLRAGIEVEENVLEAAVERRRRPAAIVGQIGPEEKIAAIWSSGSEAAETGTS
jgi:hypothetical protein